jgi:ribosomal protein L9
MKIILMDDVPTLGRRGEVRDVSDGYARNFLLPQKLALHATPANLKNIEQIKARQNAQAAKVRADAQHQAQAIEALHFAQRRQASDEGRLFGSVAAPTSQLPLSTASRSSGAASDSTSRSRRSASSRCRCACITMSPPS